MHMWDAQHYTILPEILREQLTSLAVQMNAIKESLGDFSFSLDTHHLHYHAVYQAFTGKQLAAQLLRAVNSALLGAWGGQGQDAPHTVDSTVSFCSDNLLMVQNTLEMDLTSTFNMHGAMDVAPQKLVAYQPFNIYLYSPPPPLYL